MKSKTFDTWYQFIFLFFGVIFGFTTGSRGFPALMFLLVTVCSSSDDGKLPDEIYNALEAVYSSSVCGIFGVLVALVPAS